MLGATKELQQDHTFSSRPEQWPLMRRGVAYWLDRESNVSRYDGDIPSVFAIKGISL